VGFYLGFGGLYIMVFGGRGSKDGFKLTWVFILVLGVCIVWFLVAGIIKVGYGWVLPI